MRKIGLCLVVLALAGLAFAVAGEVPAKAEKRTHEMTTEVVAVDVQAKTITIKNEKGENQTAPVLDEALESLKSVKAGDKVTLTCLDDEKGAHKGVSAIKPAKK